jgi:hypothetical protein
LTKLRFVIILISLFIWEKKVHIVVPIGDQEILSIGVGDHQKFGCPNCANRNYQLGQFFVSNRDTQVWECGSCHNFCFVLSGILVPSLILMSGDKEIKPALIKHPYAADVPVVPQRKKFLGLF